jgi:ElaB/YqjD/DUF883 family membrane-anchored ribosome-binding protein
MRRATTLIGRRRCLHRSGDEEDRAMVTKTADDAIRMLGRAAHSVDELAGEARRVLADVAGAADEARGTAREAGEGMWRMAKQARAGANGAAEEIYARSRSAMSEVGRQVEAQPYVALAVAGAVGVFLGLMLRGRTR